MSYPAIIHPLGWTHCEAQLTGLVSLDSAETSHKSSVVTLTSIQFLKITYTAITEIKMPFLLLPYQNPALPITKNANEPLTVLSESLWCDHTAGSSKA